MLVKKQQNKDVEGYPQVETKLYETVNFVIKEQFNK